VIDVFLEFPRGLYTIVLLCFGGIAACGGYRGGGDGGVGTLSGGEGDIFFCEVAGGCACCCLGGGSCFSREGTFTEGFGFESVFFLEGR
jgi:hypothetical protein